MILFSAARGLCLNHELITMWKDQEAPFSAGLLDGSAHETVDQFLQNHLAGDGLRDFDYRGQIQEFGRRQDCARRRRIPTIPF